MSVRALDIGSELDCEPRYIRVEGRDLPLPRALAGGDTRSVGFDLNHDELLEFNSIASGGVVTDLIILARQRNGKLAVVRLEVSAAALEIADANADIASLEQAQGTLKFLETYITRFREIQERAARAVVVNDGKGRLQDDRASFETRPIERSSG